MDIIGDQLLAHRQKNVAVAVKLLGKHWDINGPDGKKLIKQLYSRKQRKQEFVQDVKENRLEVLEVS